MENQSSKYIDDMVIKTYKETLTNVSNTSVLFKKLGFTINYKMSFIWVSLFILKTLLYLLLHKKL